jgi:hypothetical protein
MTENLLNLRGGKIAPLYRIFDELADANLAHDAPSCKKLGNKGMLWFRDGGVMSRPFLEHEFYYRSVAPSRALTIRRQSLA